MSAEKITQLEEEIKQLKETMTEREVIQKLLKFFCFRLYVIFKNIQKQVEAWRIEIDSFETYTNNMLDKKEKEKLEQQNENVTNIQFE